MTHIEEYEGTMADAFMRRWEALNAAYKRFEEAKRRSFCAIRYPVFTAKISSGEKLVWPANSINNDTRPAIGKIGIFTPDSVSFSASLSLHYVPKASGLWDYVWKPADMRKLFALIDKITKWLNDRSDGIERHIEHTMQTSRFIQNTRRSLTMDKMAEDAE